MSNLTVLLPTPETSRHIRDHCVCLHLQRAARAVARRFDDAFRALALTSGQFSLLAALNRPEPASLGVVAEVLAMDRTTLTANLKPLQRRGWIDVISDPADRRVRRLALTPAGRSVLAQAIPLWQQTQAELDAQLADGPQRLLDELDRLTAPVKAQPAHRKQEAENRASAGGRRKPASSRGHEDG